MNRWACSARSGWLQIAEPLEHPRLALAVGRIGERLEEPLAVRRVVRERRAHEREARLAVGIQDLRLLLLEELPPPLGLTQRERRRESGAIGLRDRHRGGLLPGPDPAQPGHAVPVSTTPRHALK